MNTKSHYRVYKSPPELLYNVSGHRGLYVNIWKVEKLCNFSSLVDLSNKSMTKNCNLGYVRTVTYFEVSSMLIVTVPPPFLKKTTYALIFQIYFVRKLYIFRAVPLPIVRRFPLYIRHWYMSCRFDDIYQCRMYGGKLLMMGRGTDRNM